MNNSDMVKTYAHIHSVLRAALIDRQRDPQDVIDEQVLVDFGKFKVGIKPEVPSGAALIAFSVLFHPMLVKQPHMFMNATELVGGEANHNYKMLMDETMATCAMAVGIHLGFLHVKYSDITSRLIVRANVDSAFVKEAYEIIKDHDLTIKDAKQLFIDLLQVEEFAGTLPLADDFIANHTFIEEGIYSVDMPAEEGIELAKKAEILQ